METPTTYLIDWNKGLVGMLAQYTEGDDAKTFVELVGPELLYNLVNVDMKTVLENIAEKGDDTLAQLQQIEDELNVLLITENVATGDYNDQLAYINEQLTLIKNKYLEAIEDIDARLKELKKAPAKTRSDFKAGFDLMALSIGVTKLSIEINNLDAFFMKMELDEADKELEEGYNTAQEKLEEYFGNLEDILKTMEDLGDRLVDWDDADDLEDFRDDLMSEISWIDTVIETEYEDPMEIARIMLEALRDKLIQEVAEFEEDKANVLALYNEIVNSPDWDEVLVWGLKDDPFGLYNNIVDNKGTLALPSVMVNEETEYQVVWANAYLLSPTNYQYLTTPICTRIDIPASIWGISANAFAENGIEEVWCAYVPTDVDDCPMLDDEAFTAEVYEKATLVVPDESIELYAAADGWKNFKNIVTVTEAGVEGVVDDFNSEVSVYSIDGTPVYRGTDNTVKVPANGVYIVKSGSKSVKAIARNGEISIR